MVVPKRPSWVGPDLSRRMEGLLKHTAPSVLALTVGIPLGLVIFYVAKVAIGARSSPLMTLQCPPGGRFLTGHMLKLTGGQSYETLLRWREEYGALFAIKAVLGVSFISLGCHIRTQ